MKLFRWVCPGCDAGTNAPSRLTYGDVRRYCLPCSHNRTPAIVARFGKFRLVERYAPSLDRKRQAASAKATTKRIARKVREHESLYVVNGIDCFKLMRKLAVLPVFGGRNGRPYTMIREKRMTLSIHRTARRQRSLVGRCGWSEIELFVWPGATEATLREILLHELLHAANKSKWRGHDKCDRPHCRHFVAKLKVAWAQAARKLGELPDAKPAGSRRHFLANMGTNAAAE